MRIRDYKTRGIILNKRRQGEADFFIDILSPVEGKLSAIAKGALKITSIFVGKLEIGQEGFFEIHITSFGYHMIKNMEITSQNIISADSLEDFLCISRLVELLKKIDFQHDLNDKLFEMLSSGLKLRNKVNPQNLVCLLKISLLDLLGYIPDCRKCSSCGLSLQNLSALHCFSGEIQCRACAHQKTDYQENLSFSQLKILNFVKQCRGNLELMTRLNIQSSDRAALENYANKILEYPVNLKLKC